MALGSAPTKERNICYSNGISEHINSCSTSYMRPTLALYMYRTDLSLHESVEVVIPEEYGQISLLDLAPQLTDAMIGQLAGSALQKLLTKQSCKYIKIMQYP